MPLSIITLSSILTLSLLLQYLAAPTDYLVSGLATILLASSIPAIPTDYPTPNIQSLTPNHSYRSSSILATLNVISPRK